jgi:hypothetical protein
LRGSWYITKKEGTAFILAQGSGGETYIYIMFSTTKNCHLSKFMPGLVTGAVQNPEQGCHLILRIFAQ